MKSLFSPSTMFLLLQVVNVDDLNIFSLTSTSWKLKIENSVFFKKRFRFRNRTNFRELFEEGR